MAKKNGGAQQPAPQQANVNLDRVQQLLAALDDHDGELLAFLEQVVDVFRQTPAMPSAGAEPGRLLLQAMAAPVAKGLRVCATSAQAQQPQAPQAPAQGQAAQAP